jgi:hypothetical protein
MEGHEPKHQQNCMNYCSYCDVVGHPTRICQVKAEEERRRLCVNKDAADYKVSSCNIKPLIG